jgi:O-methyltransferase involved in polyketide biosynthesis
MDETRASATALGSALMRAVHTRLDRPPLIEDSWVTGSSSNRSVKPSPN